MLSAVSRSALARRVLPQTRSFSTSRIFLKPAVETTSSVPNTPLPSTRVPKQKEEGTIASVFATLSGGSLENTLPPRFADLKKSLVRDEAHANAIKSSWRSVLQSLEKEIDLITQKGGDIVPEIIYPGDEIAKKSLEHWMSPETLNEIKKRGTVIIKGVVDENQALEWKARIREYVRANPQVKGECRFWTSRRSWFYAVAHLAAFDSNALLSYSTGFPEDNPQVFETYWSPSQIEARSEYRSWMSLSPSCSA